MSLARRLDRLEAAAPPPRPEPAGEEREGREIWVYLLTRLLSSMPQRYAHRVAAELETGTPASDLSPLARRVWDMARQMLPEPWTCSLAGCECGPYWEPFELPEAVCAALDEGRAEYRTLRQVHCSTCAYELPTPWEAPRCPVCDAPMDRRGYIPSPARRDWLRARAEAHGRYRRSKPLTAEDRWHLDRRGFLATLCGARPPGAPAPAPMARADGGMHTIRFDIRHPEPDRWA